MSVDSRETGDMIQNKKRADYAEYGKRAGSISDRCRLRLVRETFLPQRGAFGAKIKDSFEQVLHIPFGGAFESIVNKAFFCCGNEHGTTESGLVTMRRST